MRTLFVGQRSQPGYVSHNAVYPHGAQVYRISSMLSGADAKPSALRSALNCACRGNTTRATGD